MRKKIIPAVKPLRRLKMLAAEPTIIETIPPIDSKISFLPFINYLKDNRLAVSGTRESLYNYLIKKFEDEPALLHQVDDMDLIAEHSNLMELLTTSLFPTVEDQEKNSFALAAPYQFRVFYYSDGFRKLFADNDEQNLLLPSGLPAEELKKIEF